MSEYICHSASVDVRAFSACQSSLVCTNLLLPKLYGLASSALGIAVFITAERPVEMKTIILVVACVIIGLGFVFRSFSYELTKADKLEGLDERNQLIALKSNSRTSQITQLGSAVLTITFMGMGGVSGNKDFIAMGVGAAFYQNRR